MLKIKKVACALLVKDWCLLIQDRKGIAKYWEDWSFFWGWIEDNETPEQALFREMKEELSIDISGWKIIEWWEVVHILPTFGIEYHRYLFLVHIADGFDSFRDMEWAGAHFFPIDRLHELRFHTDISEEIAFLKTFSL